MQIHNNLYVSGEVFAVPTNSSGGHVLNCTVANRMSYTAAAMRRDTTHIIVYNSFEKPLLPFL
eukprot:10976-Heterococcus_DN1.PRE.3